MSKTLRTVAIIAAVAALVATGVGAGISAGIITASAATAKTVAAVATYASIASATASAGAAITAPKPVARGSTTTVLIDAEPPRPYMVGESYSAGILRYRVGYGAQLNKVDNPYLWEVKVFSGVGPVEGLVSEQFDFDGIGSYFTGWYASDTQLGARPEATALVPPLNPAATGWGAGHKLSGYAAIGGNYLFDKDGKVFASGAPLHGAIWRGEKCYDPRLDSTYPGGSGPHRLGVEATYTYSANPALHAGTYAYGRYQSGLKVFGLGLAADGIDWPAIVDWANTCDANGWECHGTLYEGGRGSDVRGQRVQNLDDLCAAGGGRWLTAGALLSFDWHRPRVALATLTDDDLLEAGGRATAVQSIRDRMNGVRPQYTDPLNKWEQVTADEIVGTTYRTEDGQPLTQTWALNLVKDAAQAGELAAYALADSREVGPIEIAATSKWRFYKPGECITVNSELLGYNGQAVITKRDLDVDTFAVPLTLKSETPGKHPFALGKVAVPPPTPIIGQTQQQRDGVTATTILGDVDFADVVGATKPEDNATQNAAGDFANPNGSFEFPLNGDETIPGWTKPGYVGTATVIDYAIASVRGTRMARLDGQVAIFSDVFTVSPGERIWCRTYFGIGGGTTEVFAVLRWFNAAGGFTDIGVLSPTYVGTANYVAGTFYQPDTVGMTIPSGAVSARLIFGVDLSGAAVVTGNAAFVDYFEASRTEFGADRTAANTAVLTMPAAPTVYGDVAGAALDGQLPRDIAATRTLGGVNVSASTTWSIVTTGCTATISSAGLITITACAATGRIVVTSLRDGLTLMDEFSVTKVNAQPSVSGGSTANGSTAFDTTVTGTSSTSYGGANGGPLTVTAGPAGTIALSAPLSFSGVGGAAGKWQWRIVGGSYADAGAEISSTSGAIVSEPDTGYIEVTQSVTGLTNGASYELQLLLRRVGGSGALGFNGTAVAAGS